MKKINPNKRLIPAYLFNETEKAIIRENFSHKIIPINMCGNIVHCVEFDEDAFDILDDIESKMLYEVDMTDAEKRGLATRISTVCFQSIRELGYINGANLIEVGKSLKAIGRCIALACVCGIAVLDQQQARRLLPLVRAI